MTDDKKPRPLPVRPSAGPTPVRGAAPMSASEPSREARRWLAPDGRTWDVRIEGRTRTGRGTDPGAELALVVFRPVEEGAEEGAATDTSAGALEALAVVESLHDLSELALAECFAATRPFRPLPAAVGESSRPRRRSRRG